MGDQEVGSFSLILLCLQPFPSPAVGHFPPWPPEEQGNHQWELTPSSDLQLQQLISCTITDAQTNALKHKHVKFRSIAYLSLKKGEGQLCSWAPLGTCVEFLHSSVEKRKWEYPKLLQKRKNVSPIQKSPLPGLPQPGIFLELGQRSLSSEAAASLPVGWAVKVPF